MQSYSAKKETTKLHALEADVLLFEAAWLLSPDMRGKQTLAKLQKAVRYLRHGLRGKPDTVPPEVLYTVVTAFISECVHREAFAEAAKSLCPWRLDRCILGKACPDPVAKIASTFLACHSKPITSSVDVRLGAYPIHLPAAPTHSPPPATLVFLLR